MHQRPISILTLNVRKTEMCPRGPCKARWQNPDLTDRELKVRERPIFILTLNVRKTGAGERGTDKQDREVYRHFPYNITDIQYYNTNTPTAKITEPRGLRGSHRNTYRVLSRISSNYYLNKSE